MSSPVHRQIAKTITKFTKEEDEKLQKVIRKLGTRDWEAIASCMKNRSPRQCRERWTNYLMPELSSAPWTPDEDELLEKLYSQYGSKWSKIASHFPNRSANIVRNRYRINSKKKEEIKQIKPATKITDITNLLDHIPPFKENSRQKIDKVVEIKPVITDIDRLGPETLLISNLMATPK